MRRLVTLCAAGTLLVALAGCGGGADEPGPVATPPSVGEADAPDEDGPDDDGPDESTDGPGTALPTCDSPAIVNAAGVVLAQVDLIGPGADEFDEVTNCHWYAESGTETFQINLQRWLRGGDVPDREFLEAIGLDVLDDPAYANAGLAVGTDGSPEAGNGQVFVFGSGYQVVVEVFRLDVSLDDLIGSAAMLIAMLR
ncbi:hypothetical protein [Nocardioides limicola]|uniref:hypothetical protein n=1 Tax=Nocardioides limicola TaxID=2803368 RepID=UPI00193B609F|nr:hypothetical protein [Nocardioides sp. DJM-14]